MDAVDLLYRRIVEALDHVPRDARGVPVTVGDLYQTVVPYRAVRAELGFGELAQYEHALLRLLAGERDYVRTERDEVREELQRELRAPNPILGLYRDYAGEAAFVNPHLVALVPEIGSPPAVAAPLPEPAPRAERRPPPEGWTALVSSPVEPAAAPAARPPQCSSCRTPLPTERDVRFCPFCGKCLKPVPCPDCSSMVEPEWSFCGNCGVPRPGAAAAGPERRLR